MSAIHTFEERLGQVEEQALIYSFVGPQLVEFDRWKELIVGHWW